MCLHCHALPVHRGSGPAQREGDNRHSTQSIVHRQRERKEHNGHYSLRLKEGGWVFKCIMVFYVCAVFLCLSVSLLTLSIQIHPNVVETLVSHCCNLEVVMMAGLKDVTDSVALAIAHHCPEVQHISFRNCDVTDTGVCEVAVHCSQLSMLAVAGVHSLTDKSVVALAENCPYLEELYISGCAKITKQAVNYLKVFT